MKNIVLIGMMGSGKSTCAKLLGQRLGRRVVDTDACIAAREGCAVSEIFATRGEAYFRNLEADAAKALGSCSDLIIATGGGLPMREENIAALRENGIVFWLNRDPAETFRCVSMSGRPLAQGDLADFVALYQRRAPIYAAGAHFVVEDFTTPEATVACVLKAIDGSPEV